MKKIICIDPTVVQFIATLMWLWIAENLVWQKAQMQYSEGKTIINPIGFLIIISWLRYDSITEDFEEQDNIKRKFQSSLRRPSIKFLNEKNPINVGSVNLPLLEDNDESNGLSLPAISRKPSITFNDIVDIVKMETRGSSPGIWKLKFDVCRYIRTVFKGSSQNSESDMGNLIRSFSEVSTIHTYIIDSCA